MLMDHIGRKLGVVLLEYTGKEMRLSAAGHAWGGLIRKETLLSPRGRLRPCHQLYRPGE